MRKRGEAALPGHRARATDPAFPARARTAAEEFEAALIAIEPLERQVSLIGFAAVLATPRNDHFRFLGHEALRNAHVVHRQGF